MAPLPRDYARNLGTLITALRRDLKAPELRVLLAELSDDMRWGADRLDAMDAQLMEAAGADRRTHFVDTDALPVEDGAITFGTRGTVSLGHTLADAWLQLTKAR